MLELEWLGEGCVKSGYSGYKVEKRIERREGGKRRAGRVKGIVGREISCHDEAAMAVVTQNKMRNYLPILKLHNTALILSHI